MYCSIGLASSPFCVRSAIDIVSIQDHSKILQILGLIMIEKFASIVGKAHVITDEHEMQSYLTDWRGRQTGKAYAVVKPGSTQEVAQLVKLCAQAQIPIVAQGGNTGLTEGSIPDQSGQAIVLSMHRLNNIRAQDAINNTLTVEAGCILQNIQQAAREMNRLFPLSLASEGSCTIGGNLATNAGGTAVLRYGNARDLCLGLEVVTAQGEIWDGLYSLRKDNTGYDLRDLFIGSEGTLGIITAAVLKLYPLPKSRITAWLASPSIDAALKLLQQLQATGYLNTFEIIQENCIQLLKQYFADSAQHITFTAAYHLLIEFSSDDNQTDLDIRLQQQLENALQQGLIQDAIIANTIAQMQSLWALRECIPLAEKQDGQHIKHDIALPLNTITNFVEQMKIQLQSAYPGCRLFVFGHLGDGNLHYNVAAPKGIGDQEWLQQQAVIQKMVYQKVHALRGSVAAEHGIGANKRHLLKKYKSSVAVGMMHAIKKTFDPKNLLNPGKIL